MNLPNLPQEIENYIEEARLIQAGSKRAKLDNGLRTRICEVWRPKSASVTNTGVRLETSSGRTADASDEQCLMAASGTALLQALIKFKEKLFEFAKSAGLSDAEIAEEFEEKRSEKKLPKKWADIKDKIKSSDKLTGEEQENLIGFAIKPNEFGGHKGIARDEFFTPSICRQDVNLTVTHNKIVSDLCEKLCEAPELLDDLKHKIEEISQDDEWALSAVVFNKKLKDKNENYLNSEFRKELALATSRNETWWAMKMGNFSFSVLNQGKLRGTPSSQRKCLAWQGKYAAEPQMVLALSAGPLNNTIHAKNVAAELGILFSERGKASCRSIGGQFEMALKKAGFFAENDLPKRFVHSLISKPFVILTGNSGTGKTRIGELFAQWFWASDKQGYEIVAVGSDWTDNRNIVGFTNHLIKDSRGLPLYSSTKTLDLLFRANSDPTRPYFLILDEMNLSHVERYFADFLSATESLDGSIRLHDEGSSKELLRSATSSDPWVPQKICIPNNIFIIGTVNVDETTYMFSPKVLDRANVIEFKTSTDSLADYLGSGAARPTKIKAIDQTVSKEFVAKSILSQAGEISPLMESADWVSIERSLRDLFDILRRDKHEFGFRTANEICRYLNVGLTEAETDGKWSWEEAFDAQIVQKVLPKLHGSRRKLESLLLALCGFFFAGKIMSSDESLAEETIQKTGGFFRMSFEKTKEMLLTLRQNQFVSFIH